MSGKRPRVSTAHAKSDQFSIFFLGSRVHKVAALLLSHAASLPSLACIRVHLDKLDIRIGVIGSRIGCKMYPADLALLQCPVLRILASSLLRSSNSIMAPFSSESSRALLSQRQQRSFLEHRGAIEHASIFCMDSLSKGGRGIEPTNASRLSFWPRPSGQGCHRKFGVFDAFHFGHTPLLPSFPSFVHHEVPATEFRSF